MKPYVSLAFSAWTKANVCQCVILLDFTAVPYNDGTKGELQMEKDRKWEVEGIAAVGQTSQRNSHAKMLAPLEKRLWN